jgi:hypothetical protein
MGFSGDCGSDGERRHGTKRKEKRGKGKEKRSEDD